MNIEAHLIHFAREQIKVMGADGKKYVARCIEHWREVYGAAVTARIEAALDADYKGP